MTALAAETNLPSFDQSLSIRALPDEPSLQYLTEVAHIEDEIQHLDQVIRASVIQRAELKTRLNYLKSATRDIPLEILHRVFQCLVDSYEAERYEKYEMKDFQGPPGDLEEVHPLFIVGAVSLEWRHATRSNPQLWSSIKLYVSARTAHGIRIAKQLHLFFENSADLQLDLAIYYLSPGKFGDYLLHPNIDHLIIQNLPRIKSLHLTRPPSKWHSIPDELFQLTDFSLTVKADSYSNLRYLSNSPFIRRFGLRLIDCPQHAINIDIPCDALTTLNLTRVPVHICIDLLIRCPNLVKFNYHIPFIAKDAIAESRLSMISDEPIVRDQLKELDWGMYNHPDNYHLLRSIRFPSLKRLGWKAPHQYDYHDHDGLQLAILISDNFLSNLPPTLSTLELWCPLHISHIQPLHNNENIKHLILTELLPEDVLPLLDQQPGAKIFPGLNKLTVYKLIPYRDEGEKVAQKITQMLVALFHKENSRQFCIETTDINPELRSVGWKAEEKEILRNLVAGGRKLEIIENSQPTSWLSTAQARARGCDSEVFLPF